MMVYIKVDREYLISANVVMEMDCRSLLGMIFNCQTVGIAILRWIAYIKVIKS